MNYTCPAETIVNRITEYDMKSAGYNVAKKYHLLNENKIELLEKMGKKDRSIFIGKVQREDERLRKMLPKYVELERCNFFRANKVQDEHVLSIKNDAIFVVGIKCRKKKFGNVEFVEKNIYSSYHNINGIEFYYRNKEDKLDIKGINEEVISEHEKGILKFLRKCFMLIEYDRIDDLKSYLIEFSMLYKSRKLPPIYYKEFNYKNQYNFTDKDIILYLDIMPEEELRQVNINFNYLFYVMPLLNRYLF